MTNLRRRWFLLGISILGSASAGCGSGASSSEESAPAPTPAAAPDPPAPQQPAIPKWRPEIPALVLSEATPFDLRSTLPPGIPTGGTFAVDTAGAPLPPGMTLSAQGLLSLGTASAGAATGVIFTYQYA